MKEMSEVDQEIVDNGGQSRKMFSHNMGKENESSGNINIIDDKCN